MGCVARVISQRSVYAGGGWGGTGLGLDFFFVRSVRPHTHDKAEIRMFFSFGIISSLMNEERTIEVFSVPPLIKGGTTGGRNHWINPVADFSSLPPRPSTWKRTSSRTARGPFPRGGHSFTYPIFPLSLPQAVHVETDLVTLDRKKRDRLRAHLQNSGCYATLGTAVDSNRVVTQQLSNLGSRPPTVAELFEFRTAAYLFQKCKWGSGSSDGSSRTTTNKFKPQAEADGFFPLSVHALQAAQRVAETRRGKESRNSTGARSSRGPRSSSTSSRGDEDRDADDSSFPCVEISHLKVGAEHKRRSVATMLFCGVVEHLKRHALVPMLADMGLSVFADNQGACGLYEKLGLEKTEEWSSSLAFWPYGRIHSVAE